MTDDELRELARQHPAPREWWDSDEDLFVADCPVCHNRPQFFPWPSPCYECIALGWQHNGTGTFIRTLSQ